MEIESINFNFRDRRILVIVKENSEVLNTYTLSYIEPKDDTYSMWIPIGKGMMSKLSPIDVCSMMRIFVKNI